MSNTRSRSKLWPAVLFVLVVVSLAAIVDYFATQGVKAALSQEPEVEVIVAVKDLPIGAMLEDSTLRVEKIPASLAPSGAYHQKSEVIGSTVKFPIIKDELLLPRKVSAKTEVRHLPPVVVFITIPDGSMRFNGVAPAGDGSVARGTFADILLAKDLSSPRDPEADNIWWGLGVLALSSKVQRDDAGEARLVPVVTLIMNVIRDPAEYGHKLLTASAQHSVRIALRQLPDTRNFCRTASEQPLVQRVDPPILLSHSHFNGCCQDWSTTDVKVFAGGMITYTEDSFDYNQRAGKMLQTQLSCTSHLETDEMRDLSKVLDSPALRSLPEDTPIVSKGHGTDSWWESSLKIHPSNKGQDANTRVQVSTSQQTPELDSDTRERLDCEVEEIKAKTVKSSVMPEGWVRSKCYEVLGQHSPVIVGSNEALKLVTSGRYKFQSVVFDGVGRAWFVLKERDQNSSNLKETVEVNSHSVQLSLEHAEFFARMKSDFGEP